MKPGDLVIVVHKDTFHIWQVSGVHLGTATTENLVVLLSVSKAPGCIGDRRVTEMVVPEALLDKAAIYRQVTNE